jgi:hypothetical protein
MRQAITHAGRNIVDFVKLEDSVMHAQGVDHLTW